ncbi:MAG TPA: amidase [Thermoanaerobaculia bacterium]|nr:amidase [Thermoanaerobaculia bacterium]
MTPEEALSAPLTEVAPLLQKRKLSAVALAEASLAKLETRGRELNAVVNLMRERALAEAKAVEKEIASGKRRGLLQGIPYGATDTLAAKGAPTTWGSRLFENRVFDEDAVVIRRLREAGAVLVAKLSTTELGGAFGDGSATTAMTAPGKNPWDPARWAGGSSSGSAAAVAAGLIGFAIASETRGGITHPSAFCGVSGLCPTYGRVPRTGGMVRAWTLDRLGPIARSAEDCQLVLGAIAGADPSDPASLSAPADLKGSPTAREYHVGVVRSEGTVWADEEAHAAFEDSLRLLARLGCTIEEAKLPDLPFEQVARIVLEAETVAAFYALLTSEKDAPQLPKNARIAFEASKTISGTDYVRAMQARRTIQRELDRLLAKFDVLMAPAAPFVAVSLDSRLDQTFSEPDPIGAGAGLAGMPAQVVPCGFSRADLPVGLQIIGRPLEERRILALARLFQQRTDWNRRRPRASQAKEG